MLAMEGDMDDASPGSLSPGFQRRGKKSWNASSAAGKSRSSLVYGKKSQRPKSPMARHTGFHSVDAMGRRKDKQKDHPRDKRPQERIHEIPDDVTVLKFSKMLGVPLSDVERVLTDIGEEPQSVEESLCPESAELVAMELGKTIEIVKGSGTSMQDLASAKPRPAVITVMGHVDHGKTSLLDALRSTSVAAREAGGITQHMGAFEVMMPESKSSLTFLDTPGHAAFSAMRARGAAITDIVVLVVAADDGVMPQTREAYAHAKASGCPIVVAITKCDLDGANVEKVKHEVADLGLEIEEYGGTVQVVELAAPKGIGLKELEQALLLEAELLEPKANVDVPAKGVVIESRVDKGQGPVAMVIVTAGELKRGDSIVVGSEWGKVRTLRDFMGQVVSRGGVLPGRPVEVAGLKGVPGAGDELVVVASDERAQKLSNARVFRFEQREQLQWKDTSSQGDANANARASADEAGAADSAAEPPSAIVIPVIIKADVHGSAEALKESLLALGNDAVKINIVHTGIGPITSSDVDLAVPFGCHIVGFNVKTAADAGTTAKSKDVRISNRRIIYEILQDVQDIIDGATPKPPEDVVIGNAQVLALFKVPGPKKSESKQVAGCRVVEGSLRAGLKVEVVRSGEVVHVGEIEGLRRHRLEVDSVGKNNECGLSISGWAEYLVGDEVRCVETK
jgi:translation initiation factor IF-2